MSIVLSIIAGSLIGSGLVLGQPSTVVVGVVLSALCFWLSYREWRAEQRRSQWTLDYHAMTPDDMRAWIEEGREPNV